MTARRHGDLAFGAGPDGALPDLSATTTAMIDWVHGG